MTEEELGIAQSLLDKWFAQHRDCGGTMVKYEGRYEIRFGCTCGDSV